MAQDETLLGNFAGLRTLRHLTNLSSLHLTLGLWWLAIFWDYISGIAKWVDQTLDARQDRGFIIIILFSFSSSPLSSLDMKSVIGTFDHFSLS